jgi:hypothetical protein
MTDLLHAAWLYWWYLRDWRPLWWHRLKMRLLYDPPQS